MMDSLPGKKEDRISRQSWSQKLDRYLYSVIAELVIFTMVLVDCFVVVVELILDLGTSLYNDSTHLRANLTAMTTTPIIQVNDPANTARPSDAAHVVNILILCLFVCEIVVKVVVRRWEFFRHRFEVFDLCVVAFTLLLAIVLFATPVHPVTRDAFGFIIILRIWRVTNIIFGASVTDKQSMDQAIYEYRRGRMCAEERANILQQKSEHQQVEIQRLKEQLKILQPRTPDIVLERDKSCIPSNSYNSANIQRAIPSSSHLHKRNPTNEINNRTPNGSLHSLTDTEKSMNGSVPSLEQISNTSRSVSRHPSVDDVRDVNDLRIVIESDNKRLINGHNNQDFAFVNHSYENEPEDVVGDRETGTPRSVGTPRSIRGSDVGNLGIEDERGFNASLSPEELEMVRRLATMPSMKGEGVPITSL
ncbi:uncharacterized protein LOC135482697 [Lineus longissimus]|uniref:uncharacterized protein LOC135482697 n=1 Tax=Lineus longissimus TaxID=88925 RepID=UPI002B4F8B4A